MASRAIAERAQAVSGLVRHRPIEEGRGSAIGGTIALQVRLGRRAQITGPIVRGLPLGLAGRRAPVRRAAAISGSSRVPMGNRPKIGPAIRSTRSRTVFIIVRMSSCGIVAGRHSDRGGPMA